MTKVKDALILNLNGLSFEEYEKITDIIGKKPDEFELGIFSAMWSEHCCYKSSKLHLKNLPAGGPAVIIGPGENAGVIDFGDGDVLVFKMESHNHPSYIEPFQGAATGVGGIMRDVFTMGARPVANLNSLRFGSLSHPKTPYYLSEVVKGIGFYGNCMGVPTVGGEVVFDPCYNDNILVNAFTIGIAKKEGIFLSSGAGTGDTVVYVGSATGMDGIHGATMASEEFDSKKNQRRSTVQVGDPFTEKLLLEACLEAMEKKLIVSIQDMGAAGLTSSSFEMASNSEKGMIIDLDEVPLRTPNMTPVEIMLSESQERMLLVCKKNDYEKISGIFKKWDLNCRSIGKIIEEKFIKFYRGSKLYKIMPVDAVVNGPVYDRAAKEPGYRKKIKPLSIEKYGLPEDFNIIAQRLIYSPNIASKRPVYRQYDYSIGTNTVVPPGSSCAVMRVRPYFSAEIPDMLHIPDIGMDMLSIIPGIIKNAKDKDKDIEDIDIRDKSGGGKDRHKNKGFVLNVNGNSKYCYLDPYAGSVIAVTECARNIAAAGGTPIAITDCLNFASPEDPEVMWQFKESIRGLKDAAAKFNTPVISGNVSFYNETSKIDKDGKIMTSKIYPTPVIAMVGFIDDVNKAVTSYFKEEGDEVFLIGRLKGNLGGSLYMDLVHKDFMQPPLLIDLDYEIKLQEFIRGLANEGLVKSASDISEGGLFVALAESAVANPDKLLGVQISLHKNGIRDDALLFSEFEQAFIVSLAKREKQKLIKYGKAFNISFNADIEIDYIGEVTKDRIKINNTIELKSDKIRKGYYSAVENILL